MKNTIRAAELRLHALIARFVSLGSAAGAVFPWWKPLVAEVLRLSMRSPSPVERRASLDAP